MKQWKPIFINMLSIILWLLLIPWAFAEFQYPLKSMSTDITPYGLQQIRFGIEYNRGERLLFQTENKNREIYQLPSMDIAIGISPNVEFLFSYPFLFLEQNGQDSNYGSGDLKLTCLLVIIDEKKFLPDSGLKFTVKLPNADDTREFGTDQTDFFMGAILTKTFGKIKLIANTDLAILGNPSMTDTEQDDIIIYKVGLFYPLCKNIALGFEIQGNEFSRFGNDRHFLRGGISYNWHGIKIDVGGGIGLTESSGDFQAGVGMTFKYGIKKQGSECP